MKSYLDCIPCFLRQTLDATRRITDEESVHQEVLRCVLEAACRMNMDDSPPLMGQFIHRIIREKTNVADPYAEIKERFNRKILSMVPDLKTRIANSSDPLETAVRLAIAGNVIDLGVNSYVDSYLVQDAINHAFLDTLTWDRQEFLNAMDKAQTILYLADNAGEIVFDRLLIEQLPMKKITVAVRGRPILNDATLIDAHEVGLTDRVDVMDNGSDAPGTILSDCSEDFVHTFENADLVIAKGQGNYETLSDVNQNIFFVLKAKCPVIARHIGCQVGDLIFKSVKKLDDITEEKKQVMHQHCA